MESSQRLMGVDGGQFRPRTHGALETKTHEVGNQHSKVGRIAGYPRPWTRRRRCPGGGPDGEDQAEPRLVSVGARLEAGTGGRHSGGPELPSAPGEAHGPGCLEKTSSERAFALQQRMQVLRHRRITRQGAQEDPTCRSLYAVDRYCRAFHAGRRPTWKGPLRASGGLPGSSDQKWPIAHPDP